MVSTTIVSPTSIERDNLYKVRWHNIVSIAWTNIQVELVQRNNNLIEQPWSTLCGDSCYFQHNTSITNGTVCENNYYNMLPKRNCLGMYIYLLSSL